MTDVNLGSYRTNLHQGYCVYASSDKIALRYSTYEDVMFEDFIDGLRSLQL